MLFYRPSVPLAPYVEKLWYCDRHQRVQPTERVLPNGRFQLAISLTEDPISALSDPTGVGSEIASSLLIGIRSRFSVLTTAKLRPAMGVVFRPGGVHILLNTPTDVFCNKNVPLDLILGSRANTLRDRLRSENHIAKKLQVLEIALLSGVRKRAQLNAAVQYALEEFSSAHRVARVDHIAREAGLSRRRFTQVFREQIGMSPKLFCRVQRFQTALKEIGAGASVDLAQLALTAGYYDQAHMAHEFQDFSGLSPSAHLAKDHRTE